MKQKLILISLCFLIVACENGRYIGPSVGANVGYNGASVGIALYGPNPSASNVVAVVQPTPAPTPTVVTVVPAAK